MHRILFPLALTLAVLASRDAVAATFYVDGTTGDDFSNDGLSWAASFATIGRAAQAADGSLGMDEIDVAAGEYAELIRIASPVTVLAGFPSGGGSRDPAKNPVTVRHETTTEAILLLDAGSDGSLVDGVNLAGVRVGFTAGWGAILRGAGVTLRNGTIDGWLARSVRIDAPGVRLERIRALFSPIDIFATDAGVFDSEFRDSAMLFLRGADRAMIAGNIFHDFQFMGLTVLDIQGNDIRFENNRVEDVGGGCYYPPPQPEPPSNMVLFRFADRLLLRNDLFGKIANCLGGIALQDSNDVSLENVTVAEDDGIGIEVTNCTNVTVRDSIFWKNGTPPSGRVIGPVTVTHSLVQGGFPGSGNLDADPLFVPGPLGDFYLSSAFAGQPATSPAVDAGSDTAIALGLDALVTRTDSVPDTGIADMGYHYPSPDPSPTPSPTPLTILRGTSPAALSPLRSVAGLPFLEAPGILTNPGLRTLYYEIPEATNQLSIAKDYASDSLRLDFQ